MTLAARTSLRVVLYEGPGALALEEDRRRELVRALLDAGIAVTRPRAGGLVAEMVPPAGDAVEVVVLGRFEEGGRPPFTVEGAGTALHVHDLDGAPPEAVVAELASLRARRELPEPGAWTPWFPVIDYQRCTNCMQCLSFCLFDVYGVDAEKRIQVQNNDNCKTNCPACSRVCPEVAILFPKYKKGPINGDVVKAEDVQKEAMKVDISALLGGDIYASLKERAESARKRFSTERDESRALLERKRCLKALKKDLEIPDEVLMTLPSAGEIEERARRAQEKLQKRMERSRTMADRAAARPASTETEWGI